ncbi:MAG: Nif3-like dinuclear metal center hexameric protein [Oscillospiraceae bacterium]|nr:Nif3-like dinuclear metal center hexameric protein [Oscillospiraceae bacterium]
MTKVIDILNVLSEKAPVHLAEGYDNVGFIVGRGKKEVTKVIVALDITEKVVREAAEKGAELVVSHHPVIFGERKRITDCDVTGEIVLTLAENGIAAICMHTNLDSAESGVNSVLAECLGIKVEGVVEPKEDGSVGGGRYGSLEKETSLSDFLPKVCRALGTGGVKYHDAKIPVKKVAVGGGSCGEYIVKAKALGCDTVVTADIKHNQFLDADHIGINVIDAGHFATENVISPKLVDIIEKAFPDVSVEIAAANVDCTEFFTV